MLRLQKPEGVVNEALQQIAYADRLVLNKIDLVSPEELESLELRLRAINSLAQVVRAERAAVGVEYVLGVGGFDLERVEEEVRSPNTPLHVHGIHVGRLSCALEPEPWTLGTQFPQATGGAR